MRVSCGTCSRSMFTMWFIASTPSSADRPRSGAPAACADTPWKRNFADLLASDVEWLASLRSLACQCSHGIDVLEEAFAHHVDLAGAPFLGRRTVDADRARRPAGREPVLDGDRGECRRGAEEVMAAGMAGILLRRGRSLRCRLLRDPRQRIELREDPDHGACPSRRSRRTPSACPPHPPRPRSRRRGAAAAAAPSCGSPGSRPRRGPRSRASASIALSRAALVSCADDGRGRRVKAITTTIRTNSLAFRWACH
jgi:hypothetical protein